MTYSQKYCLVQLFKPLDIGTVFTSNNWPLHVTIAGVFALDQTQPNRRILSDLITNHQTFTSTADDIDWFGQDKTVKVRLVTTTPQLQQLHETIVDFIEDHGGAFNEPHYLRQDFRPHITMIGDEPDKNTLIEFSELTLIDMFPDSDHANRRVIDTFPLAN